MKCWVRPLPVQMESYLYAKAVDSGWARPLAHETSQPLETRNQRSPNVPEAGGMHCLRKCFGQLLPRSDVLGPGTLHPGDSLELPEGLPMHATSQHAGLMWQDDFVASLFDDSTYTPSMLPNPMIPAAPLAPSNCAAVPRSSAETCRRTAVAPRSRDCQCAGVACRMHGKARRCAGTAFSPTSYFHSAMCSMDLAQDAS